MDQALLDALPLELIEVRYSKLVVGLPTRQNVIDHDEDRMPERDERPLLPPPGCNPPVVCGQVGVFRPRGHMRDLDQHLPQPDIALPGFAAQPVVCKNSIQLFKKRD